MSGSSFPYAQYFSDINMLADMQVPRQERAWLLGVPRDPQPHQVVLWLGCNILRITHLARTVADVFRPLHVDFVTVAGMAYCCGYPQHRRGDLAPSEAVSDASVRRMAAFRPETLVIWCPSCFYFYDEVLARRHSFPFALVHVTEFLAGHLDRLRPLFREGTHRRVALRAHTGTPQRDREARYGRVLLEAVPGLALMDVLQKPELGRHCTDEVYGKISMQSKTTSPFWATPWASSTPTSTRSTPSRGTRRPSWPTPPPACGKTAWPRSAPEALSSIPSRRTRRWTPSANCRPSFGHRAHAGERASRHI